MTNKNKQIKSVIVLIKESYINVERNQLHGNLNH